MISIRVLFGQTVRLFRSLRDQNRMEAGGMSDGGEHIHARVKQRLYVIRRWYTGRIDIFSWCCDHILGLEKY